MLNRLRNHITLKRMEKNHKKNSINDPVQDIRQLMDVGFTQAQALAILNVAVNYGGIDG